MVILDEKKIFAKNLKHYMDKLGKTQIDIINDLGINKSTISSWYNGQKMPRMGTIQTLADYFGILKSDLIEEKNHSNLLSFSNLVRIETKKIPILGSIHCGEPTCQDEEFEGYMEVESNIKADFGLYAKGDSMIGARIYDGDLVFIRKQDTIENGEIAAVMIDDEFTLKRVRYYPNGIIVLAPENPSYKEIVIDPNNNTKQIKLLGKAIAFQGNIK